MRSHQSKMKHERFSHACHPLRLLTVLLVSAGLILGNKAETAGDNEENQVAKAKVESCSGCSLNRLHEVKKFIYDDLPYFHNVEFKVIGGAKPDLVLLNKDDKELERIPLSKLNREECNQLLLKKGFYRKSDLEEEVPEEYRTGPYFPREEL